MQPNRPIQIKSGLICRALYVLISVISCLTLIFLVCRYALPLVIAFASAIMLNPAVAVVARKTGLPRGLAAFVVLFVFFSMATGLLLGVALAMLKGAASLTQWMPVQLDAFFKTIQAFLFSQLLPSWERINDFFGWSAKAQQKAIQLNFESMAATLMNFSADLFSRSRQSLAQLVSTLPSTLCSASLVFLAAFWLSKDSERIRSFVSAQFAPSFYCSLADASQKLKRLCLGFARTQSIHVLMTWLTLMVGLSVLRVQHAIIIAVLTGLIDLLPYLGAGIIFIPWVCDELLQHHYLLALALSAVYLTIVIQRQLLEPRIVRPVNGIDPLVALITLYIGFRWIGFPGLVLGPLAALMLKILYQNGTLTLIWHYIKSGSN
ncbi:MAG: sporulation integral membrane protein YtvI [Sporolactobacillus sp.]